MRHRTLSTPISECTSGVTSLSQGGDIFTPAITVEFRNVLRFEADANTCATIMDDNPGDFPHRVNGREASSFCSTRESA